MTKIKALALAAVVLVGAGGCNSQPKDTIDGCAKVVRVEAFKNLADPSREVRSDLDYLAECDDLSKSDQLKASEKVLDSFIGD